VKLTTFTDYCLRVLIYLGVRPEQPATIAQVAKAFEVSEHHLTKVVHFLGKGGWLANQRGKGGGLSLARPLETIGLGELVRQAEGTSVAAECFEEGGGHCCLAPACRLRGVLGEAFDAFYATLDRYTLADLVRNRAQLVQLLPMPVTPSRLRRGTGVL
jgi:Rrf2 family transcriptional regulator, nitric oxide-sensitive transcriptional repressor